MAARDEAIANDLKEALQQYNDAHDTHQRAHVQQRVLSLVDDTVHNYLAAGTQYPLMLKKMVVGALHDELAPRQGNNMQQMRACVVRI